MNVPIKTKQRGRKRTDPMTNSTSPLKGLLTRTNDGSRHPIPSRFIKEKGQIPSEKEQLGNNYQRKSLLFSNFEFN